MNKQAIQFFTTILILGSAAAAHASDKAAVIFPAEGNKTCSDYSANSLILQMGTNSPLVSGSLVGSENPRDADTTGEAATYTVTDGKVVGFNTTTPIDYALLKSSRSIALIIYPSGGVYEDANMKLTVGGVDQTIGAISLCYGLGNVAPTPPDTPPLTIPSCEALNANSGLDGVQIMCPANQERSIVYNFELDQAFYSRTGSPIACVCNSAPLEQCDPNMAYDPYNLANNACPRPADNGKNGVEVTTHIELNNDPYTCYTIGGTRTCFYY